MTNNTLLSNRTLTRWLPQVSIVSTESPIVSPRVSHCLTSSLPLSHLASPIVSLQDPISSAHVSRCLTPSGDETGGILAEVLRRQAGGPDGVLEYYRTASTGVQQEQGDVVRVTTRAVCNGDRKGGQSYRRGVIVGALS